MLNQPHPQFMTPTPEEGRLFQFGTSKTGYLFPLHSVVTNPPTPSKHYELRYGTGIPKIGGLLYTNFTTVGRGCGGHCGGATLDYDVGGTRGFGEWYIVKSQVKGCHDVWNVRWMSVLSPADQIVYPKGAVPVFLWKN